MDSRVLASVRAQRGRPVGPRAPQRVPASDQRAVAAKRPVQGRLQSFAPRRVNQPQMSAEAIHGAPGSEAEYVHCLLEPESHTIGKIPDLVSWWSASTVVKETLSFGMGTATQRTLLISPCWTSHHTRFTAATSTDEGKYSTPASIPNVSTYTGNYDMYRLVAGIFRVVPLESPDTCKGTIAISPISSREMEVEFNKADLAAGLSYTSVSSRQQSLICPLIGGAEALFFPMDNAALEYKISTGSMAVSAEYRAHSGYAISFSGTTVSSAAIINVETYFLYEVLPSAAATNQIPTSPSKTDPKQLVLARNIPSVVQPASSGLRKGRVMTLDRGLRTAVEVVEDLMDLPFLRDFKEVARPGFKAARRVVAAFQ